MRSTFRYLITFLGAVLGAGTLSPLISANWQEWAKATGNDQYLVKYAGSVMQWMADVTQSSWFIATTAFFIGGACFLWIDYFLRRNKAGSVAIDASAHASANEPSKDVGSNLAHALHLQNMSIGIAKPHRRVQVGFVLRNASDMALRYEVEHIWASVDGKTNDNPHFDNRGTVIARGATSTFSFAPISATVPVKGLEGRASIEYKYGPADAGAAFVRRAKYDMLLFIGPKATHHNIASESDDAI